MHDLRVAAVTVDDLGEGVCHHRGRPPVVVVRVLRHFVGLRDVVAVVDDDRKLRQLQEVFKRHFIGLEVAEEAVVFDRRGDFALREGEAAARFVGGDALHMTALHADEPADAAALGVREKNGVARLLEDLRQGVGVHLRVIRRRIGRHLTVELIERSLVLRELRTFIELRPESHAELPEPETFVGHRADFAGHGASARVAAPRLVDEIDGIPLLEEQIAVAVTPVGRRVPGLPELSGAVEHHETELTAVFGHLIRDEGVITVQRLALGLRVIGIVGGLGLHHGTARRETPLLHDGDGLHGEGARGDRKKRRGDTRLQRKLANEHGSSPFIFPNAGHSATRLAKSPL